MKLEEFIPIIELNFEMRFIIEDKLVSSQLFENLAPEELSRKAVRIQRLPGSDANNAFWKTLLIVSLSDKNQLKAALEWAALVKESLLDPETADLYLFICYDMDDYPSKEECLRIESTEQLCRKYVLQPGELAKGFCDRSFLTKPDITSQKVLGKDPILSAFSSVADKHLWFTEDEQQKWKSVFLSGLSGIELIDKLFKKNTDINAPTDENNN